MLETATDRDLTLAAVRLYSARVRHVHDGRSVDVQIRLGMGVLIAKRLELAGVSLEGLTDEENDRATWALISICPGAFDIVIEPPEDATQDLPVVPAHIYRVGHFGTDVCQTAIDNVPYVHVNQAMRLLCDHRFDSTTVKHHIAILRGRNGAL